MITENYIKMCGQAEEIQKSNINIGKRHFNNKDFAAYNFGEGLKVYVCSEISRYWLIDDLIWLPTQEQLQEISQKEYSKSLKKSLVWFGYFVKFVKSKYQDDLIAHEYFNEMNELWLAFVMQEKYNKAWTGEEWELAK